MTRPDLDAIRAKWKQRNVVSGNDVPTLLRHIDTLEHMLAEERENVDTLRAAARAMAEDDRRAASNLLAIIHGDGGHYEDAHGTVKACKDAEGVVSELRLKLDAATHALGLLYEETTDPSRCTVELCAGDYRHHISEPCRLAVKKALRQHSLGEKLKDLLPPDWNKPDGVEGLE